MVELDELIDEGFALPAEEAGETLALVVQRGGEVIAERYGNDTTVDTKLISWSMGKSITHALVGIGVGDGEIDIELPAPVPEWRAADDPRSSITIDHLLRMSSGLAFVEDYVDGDTSDCLAMLFGEGKDDCAAYAANQPLTGAPDTIFNYSSGTTNILCRILADIYGRGDDFAAWSNASLFNPVGIDADLTFDAAGTWTGSSFLHATARDFARFGQLYLQDGIWDAQRILPEGWVEHASTHRATDEEGNGYGAHWWMRKDHPGVFQAKGYECQRIIVDPRSDTVLVRLGKTPIDQAPTVDAWLDHILAILGSRLIN